LVSGALGLEEGEPLPEDIIFDILSRYTFLDETDILKWMRYRAQFDAEKAAEEASGDDEDGDGGGGGDDDLGLDDMGDDSGGDDGGGDMMESVADRKYYLKTRALLKEKRIMRDRAVKREQSRLREVRFRRLREQYDKSKKDIYFQFLKENAFREWHDARGHQYYSSFVSQSNPLYETFAVLADRSTPLITGSSSRLREVAQTMRGAISEIAEKPLTMDSMTEALEGYVSPNEQLTLNKMNESSLGNM
jgi:hypothetical protein